MLDAVLNTVLRLFYDRSPELLFGSPFRNTGSPLVPTSEDGDKKSKLTTYIEIC